jgi:hypothetical protein
VKNISDAGVRGAIESGIGSAIKAMQKRAGDQVSIQAE